MPRDESLGIGTTRKEQVKNVLSLSLPSWKQSHILHFQIGTEHLTPPPRGACNDVGADLQTEDAHFFHHEAPRNDAVRCKPLLHLRGEIPSQEDKDLAVGCKKFNRIPHFSYVYVALFANSTRRIRCP